MTKSEFLQRLETYLSRLPESERCEILQDQEEFMRDALASGRSESDIIASLGDPKTLANSLIVESRLQRIDANTSNKNMVKVILVVCLALFALAPFHFLIILLPFLILAGLLLAGWGMSLGLFGSSIGIMGFWISELSTLSIGALGHAAMGFLTLSLFFFGVFSLGLMTIFTQWLLLMTIRFLQWNLNLVKKLANS